MGLGVIAPFVVGLMANASADELPAAVQVNDPRDGSVRWTRSKRDLITTTNDILAWKALQVYNPYADPLNNFGYDNYNSLMNTVMGPNWQG